ncbi:hypothetical protein OCU04_000511 [Sclerotinia nivalis]|uniref:Uncharacterized protein n=1 Tax=Sclerotinia nivalis TaxID=352851 RepID=A0A9X0AX97_9HELO|nr:hypothetical protein OCU04_000511 [Sclerotinia nivalis]
MSNYGVDSKNFETRWQSTITSYTLCKLTKHTDKLIAVPPIAQELANMMSKKYLAGLWDVNILYQMTWITFNGRTTPQGKQIRDVEYVAPSWRWASIEAPVQNISYLPPIINKLHWQT